MKRIKIIPFIISILFPLVCTSFIVCYSYGVNDIYTVNKNKYEVYFQNKYYNDEGKVQDEIEKSIKLDSVKYQQGLNGATMDGKDLTTNYVGKDFTASLYEFTTHDESKNEDGVVETTKNINYSLYIHAINHNSKYTNNSEFENATGIYLGSYGSLALIYVKGTGVAADNLLLDEIDNVKSDGSTSSNGKLIYASSISGFSDNDATNYKPSNDESPSPYRFRIFDSSTDETFSDFSDLEEIYSATDVENGDVKEGYTFAIINLYNKNNATISVKELARMKIENIVTADQFEEINTTHNGYNGDYSLAGYSYFGYIWPTLLWQGGLTLLLTGILSVLFYAIWEADPEETKGQTNIKNLQKSKKETKKVVKK